MHGHVENYEMKSPLRLALVLNKKSKSLSDVNFKINKEKKHGAKPREL